MRASLASASMRSASAPQTHERRHILGERDALIAKKTKACLEASLTPVLCYGETLEERESGKTFQVMERQLRTALESLSVDELTRIVYAYEPVWAIGNRVILI